MSYWYGKGKYQKANDFLYDKLVPKTGASGTNLGEALRLVTIVYRHTIMMGIHIVIASMNKWFLLSL